MVKCDTTCNLFLVISNKACIFNDTTKLETYWESYYSIFFINFFMKHYTFPKELQLRNSVLGLLKYPVERFIIMLHII